jgi:ATP-binding cassette subfamily B protein
MSHKGANGARGIARQLRHIFRQALHVWKLVPRRHRFAFGGAALVMALTSACQTAIPLLLGRLVDEVKDAREQQLATDALWSMALLYLGLIAVSYLVREALQVFRRYLVENCCTRLEKHMTIRLVSHLMKVDLSAMMHEMVGSLNGRISRSVVGFTRFVRLAFLDLLPPLVTGGFALAAAVWKQPILAVAMAGVIPISVFLTVRQLITQKGVRLKLIHSREAMDGAVVELLGGLEYVRAAHTHPYELERLAKASEKRRARELRHHFQMSLFGCAKALNEGFFHILVVGLAISMAIRGEVSYGDILVFSGLFMNVMAPLNEVHRGIDEAHECALQVGELLKMLAEPIDRSFAVRTICEPSLANGSPMIVVENLHVAYASSDGEPKRGLDGISLSIQHGETVGVAGRSGGGKSTWLRVLMRLVHPTSGAVILGGVPLETVSRETIGRLIGYVGQLPFVFSGTVAENIAYGMNGASAEDIHRAAALAHIHDEIMAMPDGYHAQVAERGQNLSGGQRQRLALARILLKNPPILILDEGTSALDTISERRVQQAIDAARAERTVILVAHRLSTLRDVDRIFVFDGGRIVEIGAYEELLERGGVFTQLARG